MPQPARHLSVSINRPLAEVYAYARQPQNLVHWASGLAESLQFEYGKWLVKSPTGTLQMRFSEPNVHGILDHWLTTPEGLEIYVPMRAIANQHGTEIVFTLFRTPGMTDERFEHDSAWVERDLATLKRVLENPS